MFDLSKDLPFKWLFYDKMPGIDFPIVGFSSRVACCQEVIGSVPMCSTLIIKGLQILGFVIPITY
jgi:hypothetical protein